MLGRPGHSVAMAVEMDGPLEHAVLLRQRYATGKHAGLGQHRDCVVYCQYLLLTEFEGRTVSYGPSFFLLDLWPKRAINQRGKNEDP